MKQAHNSFLTILIHHLSCKPTPNTYVRFDVISCLNQLEDFSASLSTLLKLNSWGSDMETLGYKCVGLLESVGQRDPGHGIGNGNCKLALGWKRKYVHVRWQFAQINHERRRPWKTGCVGRMLQCFCFNAQHVFVHLNWVKAQGADYFISIDSI